MTKQNVTVSVIIPLHNAQEYLTECLESVRANSIMTSRFSYKNMLGVYLSVIEMNRLLSSMKIFRETRLILRERINEMIRWNICAKWFHLSRAEQTLFQASLRSEDRILFNTLVIPCAEEMQSNSNRENWQWTLYNELKNELNVTRSTYTWKIGRTMTWIPRKIRGFIRTTRESGITIACKKACTALTQLPNNAKNLWKGV